MSFARQHVSRNSAKSDGPCRFILTLVVFLYGLYLTRSNQPFVTFPFPQENCLYTRFLYCTVRRDLWGLEPKALSYLAYANSKYGTAGEVMCFLGMLHLLMLRKNKYPLHSKGSSETSATPLTWTALSQRSVFLLIFTNQKINYSAILRNLLA